MQFFSEKKLPRKLVPAKITIKVANILKAYVKDENNNTKNSTTFSNYIKNVPTENGNIMVSFDVTFLYKNIPIIDTLNIHNQRLC